LQGDEGDDGPAGGIGDGLEYVSSHGYWFYCYRSVANINATERLRKFIFIFLFFHFSEG
jgi:hypothetical protein